MSDALKVSSDVFFYQLGEQANAKSRAIQRWASKLGFGRKTGIDTGGEAAGPGARPQRGATTAFAKYEECVEKDQPADPGTMAALYKCGGIERTWTTGDNVNLAVGQGDLQATPLQVAVAYSALANNGTIVRPHLGQAIEDGNGVTVQELPHQAEAQDQDRPAATARSCSTGLHRAASEDERHVRRRLQGLADSSTRSTARPAPSSASRTPIRRGTRASSRTAASRSWSS